MAAKNFMIDIESLALTPNALVLSVGIVEFRLVDTGPVFENSLCMVPDMCDQIARGRRVDQKTQEFWMRQDIKASAHWRNPAQVEYRTPQQMCLDMHAFLGSKPVVWANGIVFDIGVLENFFAMYGDKVPWEYNATRDARTVYNVLPENPGNFTEATSDGEIAHHPLSDCRVQIRRLYQHGLRL